MDLKPRCNVCGKSAFELQAPLYPDINGNLVCGGCYNTKECTERPQGVELHPAGTRDKLAWYDDALQAAYQQADALRDRIAALERRLERSHDTGRDAIVEADANAERIAALEAELRKAKTEINRINGLWNVTQSHLDFNRKKVQHVCEMRDKAEAERDAARAWAALWKRAAKMARSEIVFLGELVNHTERRSMMGAVQVELNQLTDNRDTLERELRVTNFLLSVEGSEGAKFRQLLEDVTDRLNGVTLYDDVLAGILDEVDAVLHPAPLSSGDATSRGGLDPLSAYRAAVSHVATLEYDLESAIDEQRMAEFALAIWSDDDRFDLVFGPDDGYMMQAVCGPEQELPF